MTLPVSVLAPGVVGAGVPSTAKVTVNGRVTTMAGPVGILSDVMQFPGPVVVGNWIVAGTRVLITGIPVINQASAGVSVGAPPLFLPSGPMTVVAGDPRVMAM
jgi:hypothetical protein